MGGVPRGTPPIGVWCCVVVLVFPRVFRVPDGPAAREARASLRSAPSTPVVPGVLTYGWVRRLVVRPGLAAAHGRRSQALRRPPHLWGLAC